MRIYVMTATIIRHTALIKDDMFEQLTIFAMVAFLIIDY